MVELVNATIKYIVAPPEVDPEISLNMENWWNERLFKVFPWGF